MYVFLLFAATHSMSQGLKNAPMGETIKEASSKRDLSKCKGSGRLWSIAVLSVVLFCFLSFQGSASELNPLSPADTSSPRATFESFRENARLAWDYFSRASELVDQGGKWSYSPEVKDLGRRGVFYFYRAMQCLDNSGIPQAYRYDASVEAVIFLKEIFDRLSLPDSREMPGQEDLNSSEEPLNRWRIPGTEISLKRITSGEDEGHYLFSPETVERLEENYHRIRHLPCKEGFKPGFYDWYALTPGHLVPPRWLLTLIPVSRMPRWLLFEYRGQAVWQWIGLGLISLLLFFVILRFCTGSRRDVKGKAAALRARGMRIFGNLLIVGCISFALFLIDDVVNITGDVLHGLRSFLTGLRLLFLAWCTFHGCNFVAELLILSPRIDDQGVDASMVRTMGNLTGIFTSISLLFYGLSELGISVLPVLTGLGVAGLAISLAAKPTVENVLGGLVLFTDRPVRVGDFCRFGDTSGTVVEIGLRSTRIQGVDRTVTSIPNADFVQMPLVNVSRRDRTLLETTLGLRYETSMDQLRWILTKIRELLIAHPEVADSPVPRVRFTGFGNFSLDIAVRAYVNTNNFDKFLGVQEDLLFRIGEIVKDSGSGFAFPSSTTYIARDDSPDAARRKEIESELERWRNEKSLPFPDLPRERVKDLRNSLDYPPRGSFEERGKV